MSHPIQYYSPWFKTIASSKAVELKVFYLWDSGIKKTRDREFNSEFSWDIPLLNGYDYVFVPNNSLNPGTHHFSGLDNKTLVSELVKWNPDAILLFGYAWKSHLRVILSHKLRKVPLILRGDSHDLTSSISLKGRLTRMLKRLLLRRFSHALSVGKANRDSLISLGLDSGQITVAPHCVDNDRFQRSEQHAQEDAESWKRELGIMSPRTVALFVGKLSPTKCPMDLLEAFLGLPSDLVSRHCPALLFVGGGELEEELRKKAGDSLGNSVFFAPFQNQSQMPKVYSTGDFLVLPSKGETWGLVANEAMNFGLPVILSSQVGSARDLAIPGNTGWQFPTGDVSALRSCLKEAFENNALISSMGHNAKIHIARYSYEEATRGLVHAMNIVLPNYKLPSHS